MPIDQLEPARKSWNCFAQVLQLPFGRSFVLQMLSHAIQTPIILIFVNSL